MRTTRNKPIPNISLTIHYSFIQTSIGKIAVAYTPKGLCILRLMANDTMEVLAEFQERYPNAELREEAAPADIRKQIETFLNGRKQADDVPLDLHGTRFQRRVWQVMQRIPRGETWSYAELAKRAGNPRAVRAAANACARNPVAIFVPCHRVICSDGSLGGYGWGLEFKKRLLDMEDCSSYGK